MKKLVFSVTAALLLSFGFQNQDKDLSGNNQSGKIYPKLNCPNPPSFVSIIKDEVKKEDSKHEENEIDQNWYQQVVENIKQEEYNISYSEEHGTFQSSNRSNNIRFIYHKDGFTAKTRDAKVEKKNEWDIKFRVMDNPIPASQGDSYGSKLRNGNSEIIATGNKAYIENEEIRIDYTNTKEGMRQDFIIKNKPESDRKLRVNLSA